MLTVSELVVMVNQTHQEIIRELTLVLRDGKLKHRIAGNRSEWCNSSGTPFIVLEAGKDHLIHPDLIRILIQKIKITPKPGKLANLENIVGPVSRGHSQDL